MDCLQTGSSPVKQCEAMWSNVKHLFPSGHCNAIVGADESGHLAGYRAGYGGGYAGYGGCGDCRCRASHCQCGDGKTSRDLRWHRRLRRRFLWGRSWHLLRNGKHEKSPATACRCNCLCTKPTFMRPESCKTWGPRKFRFTAGTLQRTVQRMPETDIMMGKMLASSKKKTWIVCIWLFFLGAFKKLLVSQEKLQV